MKIHKIIWITWWILTIVVILGTTALWISFQSKDIEINLTEGTEKEFEVFRVLSDPLSIRLNFERNKTIRPELGHCEHGYKVKRNINIEKQSKVKFDISSFEKEPPLFSDLVPIPCKNLGEPIIVSLQYKKKVILYNATPGEDRGASITRHLIPLNKKRLELGVSNNKIKIRILKVGKSLSGEKVKLHINEASGLQSAGLPNHHYWLKYFIFSPIYISILMMALIVLLIFKWRQKKIK